MILAKRKKKPCYRTGIVYDGPSTFYSNSQFNRIPLSIPEW